MWVFAALVLLGPVAALLLALWWIYWEDRYG